MSFRALAEVPERLRPAARRLRLARGLSALLSLLLLTTAALMTRLALELDFWPLGVLALLPVTLAAFAWRALGAELDRRAARLVAAGHTIRRVPERSALLSYRGARGAEGALAWLEDPEGRRGVLLYAAPIDLPARGVAKVQLWQDPAAPDPTALHLVAADRWLLARPLSADEIAAQLRGLRLRLRGLFMPPLGWAGGAIGWDVPLAPAGRVTLALGGAVLGALLAYQLAEWARAYAQRLLARE